MKRSRNRAIFCGGVAAAALAFAIPAAGQRERSPESLLPPGFGEQPPPPREPATPPPPGPAPAPAQPGAPAPAPSPIGVQPIAPDGGIVEDAAQQDLEALAAQDVPPPIEIPEAARRPTDRVGPLTPANWGLGERSFGNVNGAFASALMRRLDAPLPSRWTSILLRRALLSHVPTPVYAQDVDWGGVRASL